MESAYTLDNILSPRGTHLLSGQSAHSDFFLLYFLFRFVYRGAKGYGTPELRHQ